MQRARGASTGREARPLPAEIELAETAPAMVFAIDRAGDGFVKGTAVEIADGIGDASVRLHPHRRGPRVLQTFRTDHHGYPPRSWWGAEKCAAPRIADIVICGNQLQRGLCASGWDSESPAGTAIGTFSFSLVQILVTSDTCGESAERCEVRRYREPGT